MALNDLQTKKFGEGFSGTSERVDELELPISYQSRSSEAERNENGLQLFPPSAMNLHVGAGSSGGDDELMHPISEPGSEAENVMGKGLATSLPPIREETQDGCDGEETDQPAGDTEIREHTITIPEPDHVCRACGPDEEFTDTDTENLLVKLGCHCKGSLSRMHRKCILEWYGPRICQENEYKCELCKALLHGRIERIIFRALTGRDTGRDILIKAMAPPLEPPVWPARNTDPSIQQSNIFEIISAAQRPAEPPIQPEPRGFLRSCVSACRKLIKYVLLCILWGLFITLLRYGLSSISHS